MGSSLYVQPGTRYTDSDFYDEATAERVHGWQVFIQKRPDGTPTGRRSFVDHKGRLCDLALAESRRREALAEASSDMHGVLKQAMQHARDAMTLEERSAFDSGERGPEWMFNVRDLLSRLPA